ncbi:MAG: hypothetical protein JWN73_4365 [Betaproteobacteria bacterium]|nr:hypothetical protein [Betaproteobacteria bacterium]
MEHANRAGFAGYSWAEDHAEGDFAAAWGISHALNQAGDAEDGETVDDEWFEDDLISLIRNRPSRRRPN